MVRMRRKTTPLSGLFILLLSLFILSSPSQAEEVRIEHQGLDVIGNLDIAPGKSLSKDGVVILLHDTLSHHRMEIISALQELMRERGMNSLGITLSLGLNERRGLYDCSIEQDHRNEDASLEIQSWVEWLKSQSVSEITLAGHSRGGNQVAIYAAQKPDPLVQRLVLIAPLAQSGGSAQTEYEQRFQKPLDPILAQAQKLVDEDSATALMDGVSFLNCDQARVTSGAFVNYYGQNPNLYTPSLLPHIKLPVLVVMGELDPVTQELTPAIQGIPNITHVQTVTIPAADNFFRDVAADDVATQIQQFVQQAHPGQ